MSGDISVEQILAAEVPQMETAVTETPQVQQQTPQSMEYEYIANGRTIKEPIDLILKRASQGYNYAQSMEQFNKQKSEVDARYNKALELETKYGEIDKYAIDNPEWNDHLQKTWQARFDVTGGNDKAVASIPPQFLQEFNELKTFVTSMKDQQADAAYRQSVDGVRSKFPDIDFDATDPVSGKTLERQVLEFANENGIGRFEPAFKAFYHDKLIERASLQAKEQMAKDIQQRSKAGIIGVSQVPTKTQAGELPPNYKNMNYNQIERWILDNALT